MSAARTPVQLTLAQRKLVTAITNGIPELGLGMIDVIVNTNDMSSKGDGTLIYTDENGDSFLALSIKHGAHSIRNQLFYFLKNDQLVLFAVNNNNQSLLWIAANCGEINLLIELIKQMQEINPSRLTQLLQQADKITGNTVLHIVASLPNKPDDIKTTIEITNLIISILKSTLEDESFLFQIDRSNLEGSTPLHLALKNAKLEMANLLSQEGANWFLVNDQVEQPVSSFSLYFPVTIFNNIKSVDSQRKLLDFIQQKITNQVSSYHPVITHYQKLASLVSLQDIILANLNALLPKGFFHQAGIDAFVVGKDGKIQKTKSHAIQTLPISDQEVINENRIRLNNLIKSCEDVATDLENNPRVNKKHNKLAIWFITGVLGLYFLLEAYIGYTFFPDITSVNKTSDNCDPSLDDCNIDKSETMLFGFAVISVLALILFGFVSSLAYMRFCNIDKVSDDELKDMNNNLQNLINDVPESDSQRNLVNAFEQLKKDKSNYNVAKVFKDIANLLKDLRKKLNANEFPHGFRSKPTIQVFDDLNNNDVEIELESYPIVEEASDDELKDTPVVEEVRVEESIVENPSDEYSLIVKDNETQQASTVDESESEDDAEENAELLASRKKNELKKTALVRMREEWLQLERLHLIAPQRLHLLASENEGSNQSGQQREVTNTSTPQSSETLKRYKQ